MINYKPVPFTPSRGRYLSAPYIGPAPASANALTPPPMPEFLFTGYTGVPGFLETLAVIAISGSAAWVGICTGTKKANSTLLRSVGWVGGVGSAVLGLLYLGGKSGLNDYVGLPAIRVTPA